MKQELKKKALRRLSIIKGQVEGIQRMVETERYCIDIIQQSLAVKHALSNLEDLILENHLTTHVIEQIKSGNEKKPKEEIIKIYKLSKRS